MEQSSRGQADVIANITGALDLWSGSHLGAPEGIEGLAMHEVPRDIKSLNQDLEVSITLKVVGLNGGRESRIGRLESDGANTLGLDQGWPESEDSGHVRTERNAGNVRAVGGVAVRNATNAQEEFSW